MAKTIPLTELTKIKKMMAMTTSSHDGEALNALKLVNGILKKHGITWDELLTKMVSADVEVAEVEEDPDVDNMAKNINMAFDELRGVDLGDFRNYINSIEKYWLEHKYLSPAQRKPLFNAVLKRRGEKPLRERRW